MKNHISKYSENQVFLVNETTISQSGISKMIRSGRNIHVYLNDKGGVQCLEETKILYGHPPISNSSKPNKAKVNNPIKLEDA